ncbi:hypothetical protein ACFLYQ_07120 [Chloroflexota bacterium]
MSKTSPAFISGYAPNCILSRGGPINKRIKAIEKIKINDDKRFTLHLASRLYEIDWNTGLFTAKTLVTEYIYHV